MNHFYKTLAYACAAALATLFIGVGVHFHGPLLGSVLLAAVTGLVTLACGVGTTIFARMKFQLMEVGRVLQVTTFWLFGSLVWFGLGHLASAWLTVTNPLLAGAVLIAMVVALSFVTGQIGMFGKRSLWPRRWKKD